jgi:serine O-acetyltransferase
MTIHSLASALHRRGVPLVPALLDLTLFVACGARVPHKAEIGAGSVLAHGGNGVVIHPRARIGRNVIIHQQVTIGGTGKTGGVPVIEDDVYLGAGCKVLGAVTIGHNSLVGANAVVTKSVPPCCVAAGVPAHVLRENVDAHDVETW